MLCSFAFPRKRRGNARLCVVFTTTKLQVLNQRGNATRRNTTDRALRKEASQLLSQSPRNKSNVIGKTRPRLASTKTMPTFANAISEDYTDAGAVERVCDSIQHALNSDTADLCILFAGGPGNHEISNALSKIHDRLSPNVLIGCSGFGVIGAEKEIEEGACLSLVAAKCDTAGIKPFAFEDKHANSKERDATPEVLVEALNMRPDEVDGNSMLVLVDPLTVATESALSTMDSAYPHSMKFGGLVGGGMEYGENAMFIGDRILRQGAVGLMMGNAFQPEIISTSNEVAIGEPISISVANRNVILRFEERGPDGTTPLEVIKKIQAELPSRALQLLEQTLIAGIECDRTAYAIDGKFDFVMRNIMGIDDDTGAMAIGDLVEEGQAFQFHVRDPELAAPDLQEKLNSRFRVSHDAPAPDLALCFNSITRGTRLHDDPDHDIRMISQYIDGAPAAGFFSNGEIVSGIGGFLEDQYVTKVKGYSHSITLLSSTQDGPA